LVVRAGCASPSEFADGVKEKCMDEFKKLAELQTNVKVQSKKGKMPDTILHCLLCGQAKHEVKWLLRDGGCTGGTCYCSCIVQHQLLIVSMLASEEMIKLFLSIPVSFSPK